MNHWTFYDQATGRFTGRSYSGTEDYLGHNTPAGCSSLPGHFDHARQCVDLNTGEVIDWQPPRPDDTADETFDWDGDGCRWAATPTIASLERSAHNAIDCAAGAARLRFITDVPGQQAVYMLKLQEAISLVASPGASAPHIVSEAAATGKEPTQVAEAVIAMAGRWNSVASPAIEGARIGGKAAVTAARIADDRTALQAAAATAIAALESIVPQS